MIVRVLGLALAIHADPPLDAHLHAALTDLRPGPGEPTDEPAATFRLHHGDGDWSLTTDRQRYRGPSADLAFYDTLRALDDVAALRIAEAGGVGLHGGTITIEGSAGPVGVVLVGHSGVGKSTLVARLVLDGHGFVGEEVGAITRDHRVVGYHRPIGLRQPSIELLRLAPGDGPFERTSPLVASRTTTLHHDAPLGVIAFLERSDGTAATERITPADALTRLCNQTLGTQQLEREVFRRLEHLVRAVPAVVLRYADVADGARAVEALSS